MSALTEYKCPNCGGAVEFNSATQTMKCPFCDSEFSVDAMEEQTQKKQGANTSEINAQWNDLNSSWGDEQKGMKIYYCNSCGGEIICDETTSATKCPYCDNQVTVKGAFEGGYRPDLIIPFKLDKEAAKREYMKFIAGKRFLPKDFRDKNHIDEIKGVYVPEWIFDCGVSAEIIYDATRVRTWSDNNYNYTETAHFNVYRSGNLAFSGIPVDGSSKMPDDIMESIEPFDLKQAVDFKTAYLAGYLADKYDVDINRSMPRANQRINDSTVDAFQSTLNGYASVTGKSSNVTTFDNRVRYALYPVWLLNTTYNGEKKVFAMNGQTGKFIGDLPLEKKRLRLSAAGIGAAVSAILMIAGYILAR